MKFARFAIPVIAFFIFVASASAQSVRYTGTVEGIDSPGPFTVISFSWGISNPYSGGISTGRPSLSSFNIMKAFDASDPLLIDACFQAEHLPTMHVKGYKSTNPIPFIDIAFEDVVVESHQLSGSTNNVLTASVSFAYKKISINGIVLDTTILTLNPNAINEMVMNITKKALSTTTPAKKATKKVHAH